MKLYAHRDPTSLEPHFTRHMLAMTAEGLHEKGDIAIELAWRERIGNAVPPPAAQAIASVMGETLLLAWSGETFALNAQPVWVRPIAVAAAVEIEQRR